MGEHVDLDHTRFKESAYWDFPFSESMTPKTEWFQGKWHEDLRDLGILKRHWCRIRERYLYNPNATFYSDLTASIIAILTHRRYD